MTNDGISQSAPDVSIIVPTINEAENLPPLMERVSAAMAGTPYEVLIVDDNSRDATPSVCAELSAKYPLKLLVRKEPANGLSGAVLHGMAEARGTFLCVMDADLQHPPERLPALLESLRAGEADFVLGSRYMPGGSTEAEWGLFRKFNSQLATFLARPFAGKTTDPMAGFFALRRESYAAATNLTPLGYKIALELMCKCRVKRVKEIPIHFGMREKGQSKLSLKQQFRYLEHLSRLYDFTYPRASPIVKFFIATVASWVVGLGTFLPLIRGGDGPVRAISIAYLPAIAVTAIFHIRYVRTQREFLSRQTPWMDFVVISIAEWIIAMMAAYWIGWRVKEPGLWETFILSFGLATLTRYVLRKEFLLDIRGLRRSSPREAEIKPGQ
ncbi:MAG TPA: polyprenol monophosphomannose synthase [Tepidisphaeraceae bacterium]